MSGGRILFGPGEYDGYFCADIQFAFDSNWPFEPVRQEFNDSKSNPITAKLFAFMTEEWLEDLLHFLIWNTDTAVLND